MAFAKPKLLWIFLSLFVWLHPASAQSDFTSLIVARLQTEDYVVEQVRTTWLGRILIVSQSATHLREIVLHQHTGEILRDKLFPLSTEETGSGTQTAPPSDASPGAPEKPAPGGGPKHRKNGN